MFDSMLITENGMEDISPLRELNDKSDTLLLLQKLGLETIENYTFENQLNGGMASLTSVFKNTDEEKVLFKFLIMPRNDSEYQRFINEYQALKKIEVNIFDVIPCPKILIDFQQHDNLPIFYFAMEYFEGETLSDMIEKKSLPWKWQKVSTLIHKITINLASIHSNQYAHRDLHEGNILITSLEENISQRKYIETGIRILDLGNRLNTNEKLLKDFSGKRKLIEDEYRLEGAISSWSPEYILNNNKSVYTAQDIWSIGVLIFRLLTGKYPIQAENISELIQKYKRVDKNIQWYLLPTDIPKPIKHLLLRMLEADEYKRIHTVATIGILYDLRFLGLLECDSSYIEKYLRVDGQIDDPLDYIY